MGECKLGFREHDNGLAYNLYQKLIGTGALCQDMDIGHSEINYAGIHCPDKDARTCIKGAKDGVISPEEVFEYGLNNYERYQKLLHGVLGQPVPWVLDDLDPWTKFDEDVRKKVQSAIDILKDILNKAGVKEGTEEYKKRLAVGLFWLAAFPMKEKLNTVKISTKGNAILDSIRDDLKDNGLADFWGYLIENGGFRIDGDYSEEYDALTAIDKKQGKCTEKSKILFAIFKIAGFEPLFVIPESKPKLVEEVKGFKLARYFEEELNSFPPGSSHIYIGHRFDGGLRFFDPSFFNSNAGYKEYYLLSLRQYLSLDRTNHGVAWAQKGERNKAIADYGKAIEINLKNDIAYHNRGNAWARKGDFDKAIADFDKAIEINPKDDMVYYNRGVTWGIKGELDKAIADYDKAIEINPKNDMAYYNRGVAWGIKDEIDKAIADFDKAIEVNPKDDMVYVSRGVAWFRKGEFDKAIADFTKVIEINPKDDKAYFSRGLACDKKGEFDKAIADYNKVIEFNPKNDIAYYNRGAVWIQKDEINKAIADFTKAIEINPKYDKAYFGRGVAWFRKGEFNKAIADFSKAIEIDPKLAPAYFNRGNAWYEKGELDNAIADYSKAIEIFPKYATAYYNRGVAWGKKGELDKAIADYSKAIEIDLKDATSYNNRGVAWGEKGELDKAIADYSKAIEIDPKLKGAYLNLGACKLQKSDFKGSIEDISIFLKLSGNTFNTASKPLSDELEKYWSKGGNKIAQVFKADTGLDISQFETGIILSYCLWNNDESDQAAKILKTLDNAMKQKVMAPATTDFFKAILGAMPEDMGKDDDIEEIVKSIKAKTGIK